MSSDYKVGYRKPPQRSQFKKGQSGNPRGRPAQTVNLKTDLLEELQENILVREGPTERRLSKQRAMLKSLIMKAIKGDTRASHILLGMMLRLLASEGTSDAEAPLTEDERTILATLEARILRRSSQEPAAAGRADAQSRKQGGSDGDE